MSPDELAAYVRTLVDKAPPLREETREQISTLLRSPTNVTECSATAA